MVAPKDRSRSARRVSRKAPGGRTTLHFKPRKPAAAKCGECGSALKGVPREQASKMANMPKSSKRPERPFGGSLCSSCTKKHMVSKARSSE